MASTSIEPTGGKLIFGFFHWKYLQGKEKLLLKSDSFFLPKTISSIPVLGKILVGDKTGEGVFGVSFKIKGPPKNLETTVNPIKTLTPRFITRTIEKIKKN